MLKDECEDLSWYRSKAGNQQGYLQQVRRQRQDRLTQQSFFGTVQNVTTCPGLPWNRSDHQGEVPGLSRHRVHREKEEDRGFHSRRH